MSEPNDRLDRAWRSLAREEPPASLDATILAAAHRAVARPSLARRWGVPVSIAAVLMLAVGVTLEMQREKPGIEVSAPSESEREPAAAMPAPEAKQEIAPATVPEKKHAASAPQAKPQAAHAPVPNTMQEKPKAAVASPREESRRKDATAGFAPAPRGAAPEAPAAREAPRAFPAPPASAQANVATHAAQPRASAPSPAAPMPPAASSAPAPAESRFAAPAASRAERSAGASADLMAAPVDPARELERIAKLRDEGREAQADRALEEFRKRFPAYRIDDATWQRVKPR